MDGNRESDCMNDLYVCNQEPMHEPRWGVGVSNSVYRGAITSMFNAFIMSLHL